MNEHLPTPNSDLSRRLGLDVPKRRVWTWGRSLFVLAALLILLARIKTAIRKTCALVLEINYAANFGLERFPYFVEKLRERGIT